MMKRRQTAMILLFILLIVLLLIYALLKNSSREETVESEESVQLVSITEDKIERLAFQISGEEEVFIQSDDGWRLESDENYPVNEEQIQILTAEFLDLRALRILENVENLSEYGLDEPKNRIQIVTEEETVNIAIGDSTESTGYSYIYLNDDKSIVYTVDADLSVVFSGSLMNYAQGENFPVITASNITYVELQREEHSFTLEQSQEVSSGWMLTDATGKAVEADRSEVGNLQSAIAGFAYTNYYEYDCKDPAAYGFEKPYAVLTVNYLESAASKNEYTEENTETEEKTLVIHIGDEDGSGNRYTYVDNSGEIHAISEEALETVLAGVSGSDENLTFNQVLLKDIERLSVEHNGETHVFTLEVTMDEDNNETTVYYLDGKETDTLSFSSFFNHAVSVEAQQKVEWKDEFEETADIVLTFHKIDGSTVTTSYYPYDSNFYLAVRDNENAYLVNKMKVRALIREYETLLGDD